MTKVTIIGAEGFVGSAFAAHLSGLDGLETVLVTRRNYPDTVGTESDVVIEAACNSRKYLADQQPAKEFDLSVTHRLRTLRDFPADLHVHISSVDVYSDLTSPEFTQEDSVPDITKVSHYGFHKLLGEQAVQHYSHRWLIVRLAGMVGLGLRKNPVYDILNGEPLRIHPNSQYQFMDTADVARITWKLLERGVTGEIFNLCGEGLISPSTISGLAGREMNLSMLEPMVQPRIVNINIQKISRIASIPDTCETVTRFIGAYSKPKEIDGRRSWAT